MKSLFSYSTNNFNIQLVMTIITVITRISSIIIIIFYLYRAVGRVLGCEGLPGSQPCCVDTQVIRSFGKDVCSLNDEAPLLAVWEESFELHVYCLTYICWRSSGVPQSVVHPMQASGVIPTPV